MSFLAKIKAMDMVTVYETIVITKESSRMYGIRSKAGKAGSGKLETFQAYYLATKN